MTAAPARPLPARRASAGRQPQLTELLADLGRLGLHGRIFTEWIAGDQDVRLQAWRDAGEVTVELLWCHPDALVPRRPEAVRIAAGQREVWRSVHGRCASADIVRFLSDLLLLDEDTLAGRYLRLG